MIRGILEWFGIFQRENHLSPELERAVASIFKLESFRTERGHNYSTQRF